MPLGVLLRELGIRDDENTLGDFLDRCEDATPEDLKDEGATSIEQLVVAIAAREFLERASRGTNRDKFQLPVTPRRARLPEPIQASLVGSPGRLTPPGSDPRSGPGSDPR